MRVLLVVLSIVVLLAFIIARRGACCMTLASIELNPSGREHGAVSNAADLDWPVERWREPTQPAFRTTHGNVLVITRSRRARGSIFSEQELDLLDDG